MKDLVVLVADKNMEQTVKGLLGRHQSLGIRPVNLNVSPKLCRGGFPDDPTSIN